jgi:hypothetical protein
VKTAAVVLGIIGGVLDALLALFVMVFGGLAANALLNAGIPGLEGLAASGVTGSVLTAAFVIAGFVILLVAVLGIVGGAVARKNPTLGGILMLVAGGLNLFGGWPGFIIGALLIAGGILALVAANEAKKTAPPAPAAPAA